MMAGKAESLGKRTVACSALSSPRLDGDPPLQPVQLNRSRVTLGGNTFNARNSAPAQKLNHSGPVVWRLVAQQKNDLAGRPGTKVRSAGAPQFARRAAEQRLEGFVETANAAEPRGERDFGHRQPRLMDELLGKQNAAGLRDRHRRRAEMLAEQTPELPFAQA
jgi:hypothetical protein